MVRPRGCVKAWAIPVSAPVAKIIAILDGQQCNLVARMGHPSPAFGCRDCTLGCSAHLLRQRELQPSSPATPR